MARRTLPLTDTEIKKAKQKDKGYKLFDGDGLFLFVNNAGGKLWRLKYISPTSKKEKTYSIGKYPDITLATARSERERLRQLIKSGIDPSQEKQENKKIRITQEIDKTDTFSKIAEDFLAHKTKITDDYKDMQRRRLERHIYPSLKNVPIKSIVRADIIELIRLIEANGTLEMASRVFSLCNEIFRYAAANDKIPYNILQDIDKKSVFKQPDEKHYPVILDEQEIKILLDVIDDYKGDISTKYALRLLPHLASRPGNIRVAEWKEIDFENSEWIIPGEKMKIKVKYKGTNELQPHIVPLSKHSMKIIKELKKFTGDGPYLFPSTLHKDRPMSDNTLSSAMKRLGYKDKMNPHSFRAMFSTILHGKIEEHGFHSDIIERQLAHKERNKVKAAYNHAEYLPQRKKMMQWWSNYLDKVKNGSTN